MCVCLHRFGLICGLFSVSCNLISANILLQLFDHWACWERFSVRSQVHTCHIWSLSANKLLPFPRCRSWLRNRSQMPIRSLTFTTRWAPNCTCVWCHQPLSNYRLQVLIFCLWPPAGPQRLSAERKSEKHLYWFDPRCEQVSFTSCFRQCRGTRKESEDDDDDDEG